MSSAPAAARPLHPPPEDTPFPQSGNLHNNLAGYTPNRNRLTEEELPSSTEFVRDPADPDPKRAAKNKNYPAYLPLNGPRSIESLGNGISARLSKMKHRSINLRAKIIRINWRLNTLNTLLQAAGTRLQGDERINMLTRVTQILRKLDGKVQALDNSSIGENGLKAEIERIDDLVTRLEAQSTPVTASSNSSRKESLSVQQKPNSAPKAQSTTVTASSNSVTPSSAYVDEIPTVSNLLRRPRREGNSIDEYNRVYPQQEGGGMFSMSSVPAQASPDKEKRVANAKKYLDAFLSGSISVKDALQWFEGNIWKPYVFKSKTMFTLGYGSEYRALYTEEFQLLHTILKKLNASLLNLTVDQKRIKLYTDINVDEHAVKCINHIIRYYSDCLDKYNSYKGLVKRALLNRGVLATRGYETPSIPNPHPTPQSIQAVSYFSIVNSDGEFIVPNPNGVKEGWEMIFAILSAIGGDTFVSEDKLGETVPPILSLSKLSVLYNGGDFYASRGGQRKSRKRQNRKTKKSSKKSCKKSSSRRR